ncbi:MAG: LysR family transcriptional regulator [Gemmatimonadetes bacterium]|nr:LysR family transcriptional regulator [Gemmatimonadota bacterium]MBT8405782.1 LysR family transcriptional regulator [Gemmatimonadota bacterium]NNK62109.1 LysR family transcriptional regulator [Gemmatimonadota bacterium]
MADLNYHHLRYFWVVAREGTITRAADLLGVTQPTISAQISALEDSLGVRLFRRRGNRLVLTDTGRMVQEHASTIFRVGERIVDAVRTGDGGGRPTRFAIGVADSVPLLSAHRLLAPALTPPLEGLRVVLRVDKRERLLAALAARTLDFVLVDAALGPTEPVDAHSQPIHESEALIFGAPSLVEGLDGDFPAALEGAPFVLHTENTPLRRGLDAWFARHSIRPRVAAEVEDVGFLQLLGQDGLGFFVAPSLVSDEIVTRYGVQVVGTAEGVSERFFGITLERRPGHPGVQALLGAHRG